MEPLIVPIEDALDLHTFQPREIPDLLDDYFDACQSRGMATVRLIHGKGKGILRARIHSILKEHPRVKSFRTAPESEGGWGATLVELKT
jgi:DNA-nicking Smr family endonuclease